MVSSSVISFFNSLLGDDSVLDIRSCRSGVSLGGTLDVSGIDCDSDLDECVVVLYPVLVPVSDIKNLSFEVGKGVVDPLLECNSVQIFNFDFRLVLGSHVKQAKIDSGFCGDIDFEVDYAVEGDYLVLTLSFFMEEL